MKIARVIKAKNVRQGDWVLTADHMTIGAGYAWRQVTDADDLGYGTQRITVSVGDDWEERETFDPDDRVLVMR